VNIETIPFSTGILSVLVLFLLSFVLGAGLRAVFLALKVLLKKQKPKKPRVKNPRPQPSFKSIEIDPEEIDRIYVKKT